MEQEVEQQAELPAEQPEEQAAAIAVEESPSGQRRKLWLPISIAAALALLILVFVILAVSAGKKQESPDPSATESVTRETESVFLPNPYGPTDFQYAGDYLTCLAGESVLGIDVSSFQGDIDWEQVRSAGVEFVMIRIGGRGYGEEGRLYADTKAQENYAGAKAAGLQVGAYFFSQAISVAEAKEEAAYALELIRDWELEMPVVYDWEYLGQEARTANVDKRTLTDCTLAFCRDMEDAGREAMTYFNPNQSDNHIYLEELTEYRSWLALYSDRMTFPYRVDMWQYTNAGSVPGIEGEVDLNLYFPY